MRSGLDQNEKTYRFTEDYGEIEPGKVDVEVKVIGLLSFCLIRVVEIQ